MDDPRGITPGNNETCMAPLSAHLFDKCMTNKVIYKKN